MFAAIQHQLEETGGWYRGKQHSQHCHCVLLCSGPESVKSPQVLQQPLVPGCAQHTPTAPRPWDSRSPGSQQANSILCQSIYNTSHLCILPSLPFLTTSRPPWNNVLILLALLLCLTMSHSLVQKSFSRSVPTFLSQ